MNLFKFALRNILRYRTRTIYASLSIFIASIIVVFAQGYVGGISRGMMEEYKNYLTGDLKITTDGFVQRENLMPVDEIFDESILDALDTIEGIELIEPRFRFGTLLGKEENTEPAIGIGLDFERTRFRLKDKLIEGSIGGMIVTKEFSKKIGVNIGDSILVVSKTSEGGINGIKIKITGIAHFGIGMIDRNMFFISIEDARRLLRIKKGFTELFVYTSDKKVVDKIKKIKIDGISIRKPGEQIPFLDAFGIALKIYSFLELLIFLLASFVILNLMTMIVFERIREIGTLKALGMRDNDVFRNFVLEGMIIGSIGSVLGSFFGYLILFYLHNKGINFEGAIKNTDLMISYIVYPDVHFYYVIISIIMAIFISGLAAMIPAFYAKKFTPQEALRKI